MKVAKFIVALLIIPGILAISLGAAGGNLENISSNGLVSSGPGQIKPLAPIEGDMRQVENGSVADGSLSQPDPIIQPELPVTNDPDVQKQWALNQIEAPKSWQITMGKPEILVAVLDTGIDQSHEDLEDKVIAEVNFTDSPTSHDIYGHGTHIAGIISANSNNGIGITGVAPECRLMNIKIADDTGECQSSVLAEGIVWASDNGASVINISVGFREPLPELADAVDYAWKRGAVITVAAGNQGTECPTYPAYYERCIAVAATGQDGILAPLSNYGIWVDVAAPGFNIYSTLPDNGYDYKTGTSFATAYVSGLAALLFSLVTDTNGNGKVNDEVRAAIEAGCQEMGIHAVGQGRINAANSLAKITPSR
jgi:thermitase